MYHIASRSQPVFVFQTHDELLDRVSQAVVLQLQNTVEKIASNRCSTLDGNAHNNHELLQFHYFPTLSFMAFIAKTAAARCINSLTTLQLLAWMCSSVCRLLRPPLIASRLHQAWANRCFLRLALQTLFLAALALLARQQFLQGATRQPVLVSVAMVLPLLRVCAAIFRSIC